VGRMTNETDPARCERCGRCCCKKMVIDDEVIYTPHFCEHYDPESRLCRIYDRRHELNPNCLTVEEGAALGVFPADCPYVRDRPGYRPPRMRCTDEELREFHAADDDSGPSS